MTPNQPDPQALNAALRRVHFGVLGWLALSAVLVATLASATEEISPAPGYSLVALLLAAASILARREPSLPLVDVRPALRRAVMGLGFAGALGALGVAIAFREGAQTTGLLYALAGAFLSLRPPPQVVVRDVPAPEEE